MVRLTADAVGIRPKQDGGLRPRGAIRGPKLLTGVVGTELEVELEAQQLPSAIVLNAEA